MPPPLVRLVQRFRAALTTTRVGRDVDEELTYHIEMRSKQYEAEGMSPAGARRTAMRRFGDFDRTRLECHRLRMVEPATHGDSLMSKVLQDVRFAFRSLRRHPGFTAVVLGTLALGIGANAAIYSVVDTVLLRPLPFPDADRLMILQESDRLNGTRFEGFSLPDFFDVQERNEVFSAMAAYNSPTVTVTDPDLEPVVLQTTNTSYTLFSILGTPPSLGRSFTSQDDQVGAEPVVILSHQIWMSRFGGDPGVVGGNIILNGVSTRMIGVMPEGFAFPAATIDLWVPMALGPSSRPRGNHGYGVIATLRDGLSVERANNDLSLIASALEEEYPRDNQNRGMWGQALYDALYSTVRPQLLILMGAVGFVLLIACVNVANLLFARASTREREVAVRVALGAGRGRLIQQFLTESVLTAVLGGVLGLAMAFLVIQTLVGMSPANIPRMGDVGIDWRVLGFTLVVSLVTGVVFGLVPALQSTNAALQTSLKEGGRSGSSGARQRLRRALVVAEVGMAVILVTGAGLLIKSFSRLSRVDPGFNPARLVQVSLNLPASRYPQVFADWPDFPEVHAFQRDLLERMDAVPDVESAAIALNSPVNAGWTTRLSIDPMPPYPPADLEEIRIRTVSPDYFSTVGVELVRGRMMTPADDRIDAPQVAVVNEAFGRRYFQGEDPLGYRVTNWGVEREIVGVVRDVRFSGLDHDVPPAIYPTFARMPFGGFVLLARVRGTPEAAFSAIRDQVWSLDRDLALNNMSTVEENLNAAVAQPRFNVVLLSTFAGIALTLAAVGIYGVMAYGVNRRTQEIGIRLSLGEGRANVLRRIVGEGAVLALMGIALGALGALGLTRLLRNMLFEVDPIDVATFASVMIGACAVAVLASLVPGWRASRLNPVAALRRE